MAIHNDFGKIGEGLAKDFIAQKGYEILETNMRIKRTEIDIVAMHDNKLIFVEVKSRKNMDYRIQDLISRSKQATLLQAAELYKIEHDYQDEIFFELVCVIFDDANEYRFEHYTDILYEL
jgi:putative endonuclease